jgi:plastocyanin
MGQQGRLRAHRDRQEWDFDVTLQPNKSSSFVLKKAGNVDYYCRFHPNMKATLKVAP